jgi:hypothetical protein
MHSSRNSLTFTRVLNTIKCPMRLTPNSVHTQGNARDADVCPQRGVQFEGHGRGSSAAATARAFLQLRRPEGREVCHACVD